MTGNAITPSRASPKSFSFSFPKSPTEVCPWGRLSLLLEGCPMAAVLHTARSTMASRNRSFTFLRLFRWFVPPDQKGQRAPSKYRSPLFLWLIR
jgi:hypothetical protein